MALWRKLRWSITHRGLLGTIRAVPAALTRRSSADSHHPFDQRYGTDTSGLIGGGRLTTGHPHDRYITAYAAVAPSRFEAAVNRWAASIAPKQIDDYTFIDLGCGKGRVLLLASRLPFREVIGIELNPELAATAERNVAHWRTLGQARTPIRLEIGDASAPTLPAGPVLLFLYNAFAEPLVCRLADTIARSTAGQRIDVIYQNANHANVFTQKPGFLEVWRAQLQLSPEDATADPVAARDDLTVHFRLDTAPTTRV